MTESTVGIHELKANLSRYLKKVSTGATIAVGDRNEPVAQMEPAQKCNEIPLQERMVALREGGILDWHGLTPLEGYQPRRPTIRLKTERLASDLLLEDRR